MSGEAVNDVASHHDLSMSRVRGVHSMVTETDEGAELIDNDCRHADSPSRFGFGIRGADDRSRRNALQRQTSTHSSGTDVITVRTVHFASHENLLRQGQLAGRVRCLSQLRSIVERPTGSRTTAGNPLVIVNRDLENVASRRNLARDPLLPIADRHADVK